MNRVKSLWSRLRRITKINLILGTIFALLFGYIAMATYFGTASQVRYTSNDFPGAKKAATAFLKVSPFQRHIGYYNRGTAEAAVGDFDAAQRPRSRFGHRPDFSRMCGADQPVLCL